MKRIDSRTVEFTHTWETEAVDRFEQALDDGADIMGAATIALNEGLLRNASFTRDFVEYLSEDTVILTRGGKILPTAKGRRLAAQVVSGQ